MSRPLKRTPLHRQIANRLQATILRQHRPGDRLHSEYHFAKDFGVSIKTVREALSALAAEGLIERHHGRGTFVAQHEAKHCVAVLMSMSPGGAFSSWFWQSGCQKFRQCLEQHGVPSRLYWMHEHSSTTLPDVSLLEFQEDLRRRRIDAAAVIVGPVPPAWNEVLVASQLPVVGLGAHPRVKNDYPGMVRSVVDRFLASGRRDLAFLMRSRLVDGPSDLVIEICQQRGLTLRPNWFRHDVPVHVPGAGYEAFREIWTAYDAKPDGLFVADDVLFQDTVPAMLEMRLRVPEQLLVIATGNKGGLTCPFFPAYRVVFDPEPFAQAKAELLLRMIHGEPLSQSDALIGFDWQMTGGLVPPAPVTRSQTT